MKYRISWNKWDEVTGVGYTADEALSPLRGDNSYDDLSTLKKDMCVLFEDIIFGNWDNGPVDYCVEQSDGSSWYEILNPKTVKVWMKV